MNKLEALLKLADFSESGDAPAGQSDGPWKVGEKMAIRTVTMTLTGRIVEVWPSEIVLEDAAWVADSGRWADFVVNPMEAFEVEPFVGRVIVGRGAVVDATAVDALPTVQK